MRKYVLKLSGISSLTDTESYFANTSKEENKKQERQHTYVDERL